MPEAVSINKGKRFPLVAIINDQEKNDQRYVFLLDKKGETSLSFEFVRKDIKCTLEYLKSRKHMICTRRDNIMKEAESHEFGTEEHYYAYQALVKMRDRVKREILAKAA